MDITTLTALELSALIKSGKVTVVEATKAALEKIKEREEQYN